VLNHYRHDDVDYHAQIEYCLDNDVRFDAIGIQTHMHTQHRLLSEEKMWAFLQLYSAYRKPLHLSEVTLVSSRLFDNWRELKEFNARIKSARQAGQSEPPSRQSTARGEQRQAQLVHDFYTLAFSHPAVDAIVWWNLSDEGAWRGSAGGLLSKKMEPKPAYEVLQQLINKQWRTLKTTQLPHSGRIALRGFKGLYNVRLTHTGEEYSGEFRIVGGKPVRIIVNLVAQPHRYRGVERGLGQRFIADRLTALGPRPAHPRIGTPANWN